MIAPNIILMLDDDHANIPSGYTRETTLDSKYIKGTANATDPNDTGGNSTHTHTGVSSHNHALNAHTHTGTSGARNGGASVLAPSGSGVSQLNHTHTYTTGAKSGGDASSTTANYGAFSNDPNYYTVIFIKASAYTTIPNNAIVLGSATSRSGLVFHSASANKFLKGAGTGANAGSTGGSTTNVHNINHTHTVNSHTHASANTNGASSQASGTNASPWNVPSGSHYHTATVGAGTQAINAYTNLTTTETVEPAFTTLNAFKNESGSGKMPTVGDIALWLGTLATIPVGWKLCDGSDGTPDMRGRYYKNPSSASASTTGGSNTHSHASQGHTHTSNGGHTHSVSFGNQSAKWQAPGGSILSNKDEHNHLTANSNSTTATYASGNTSANSSNNEPEYRTVAFIQFEFATGGGSIVTKMLN